MITGDNHLTALKISRELSFGPTSSLNLVAKENKFYWSDSDKTVFEAELVKEKIKSLSSNHTLCLPGETISLLPTPLLILLVNYVNIYARTSPSQKELLIHYLKMNGFDLLMCGDGTNDVGALKKADIGIALVGLKDGKVIFCLIILLSSYYFFLNLCKILDIIIYSIFFFKFHLSSIIFYS